MHKAILILGLTIAVSCSAPKEKGIPIIIDSDANNELDDQHALAYLFMNTGVFDIRGITINATSIGGDADKQSAEAARVMQLCDVQGKYPLIKGANGNFAGIAPMTDSAQFDGCEAVNFIIRQAMDNRNGKLVLAPIGKLTNIALALKKEPLINERVRIVWLGSNYPASGEYNLINDTTALNYILNLDVEFEMVTVRYGDSTGTDAVRATPKEISDNLAGKGPEVSPVEGRHGGMFTTFGDYSVNLFSQAHLTGERNSRALYDMVVIAIIKNPEWGSARSVPAPIFTDGAWQERPGNSRRILIWENFEKDAILADFYKSFLPFPKLRTDK